MSEPILDPSYWKARLREAALEHHAIFRAPEGTWKEIAEHHKGILLNTITRWESVLDVGCGWGRLLDLMPWHVGQYLGIDLSPDFVEKALRIHPGYQFLVRDVLQSPDLSPKEAGRSYKFDWAVCISMRPMIINNLGGESWDKMSEWISRHARKLLLLEYSVHHKGEVVTWD